MMIERNIKTIIVTGPTGAVGTALCSRLLQAGCTVVAVCRPQPAGRSAAQGCKPVCSCLRCRQPGGFAAVHGRSRLPVQADAFFHLAWAHTIGAGRNDMPAQIENIRYTIDAVRTAAAMAAVCLLVPAARQSMAVWTVFCGPIPPQTPKTGTAWPSCVQAR